MVSPTQQDLQAIGAVLAAQWRRQWQAALLTFVLAAAFDLLFLVISKLPATGPWRWH